MPGVLLRENVHRDGFLPTLGARTWRPRAAAAAALADVGALASPDAYAAWLRRAAAAWSRLPLAPDGDSAVAAAATRWPLSAVGPDCLDGRDELAADLGVPAGGDGRTVLSTPADGAFLVGAAYVAVVAAGDAAVLTDAAVALAADAAGAPVGTRFLRRCHALALTRPALRRELADWAAQAGPEAAERAVLTASTLSADLAETLGGARRLE